jgi:hypothetical protein
MNDMDLDDEKSVSLRNLVATLTTIGVPIKEEVLRKAQVTTIDEMRSIFQPESQGGWSSKDLMEMFRLKPSQVSNLRAHFLGILVIFLACTASDFWNFPMSGGSGAPPPAPAAG